MKFLPENRKKTMWSVALIAVFIGATIFVLKGSSGGNTAAPGPASTSPSNVSGSTPVPVNLGSAELLPYGSKIDTKVLNSDKFKALRPTPPLTVSPAQLGNANLFGK
jgi:hypothetical protein